MVRTTAMQLQVVCYNCIAVVSYERTALSRHQSMTCLIFPYFDCFYRAMHFSAKRGIAIACRLSVRLSVSLSVTLVNCDHIG